MKQTHDNFITNIDYSNNSLKNTLKSYMDSVEFVKKLVEQTIRTLESEESITLLSLLNSSDDDSYQLAMSIIETVTGKQIDPQYSADYRFSIWIDKNILSFSHPNMNWIAKSPSWLTNPPEFDLCGD